MYDTLSIDEMSAGDALQKLYSETESMGPDVGGVLTDLESSPADTKSMIRKIKVNSKSFQTPQGASKHFTDVVGEAREAADNNDPETALELLDEIIIDHLKATVTTFSVVKTNAKTTNGISGKTIAELDYVETGYEHMKELAEHAREETRSN
jgi:hypothetical protein